MRSKNHSKIHPPDDQLVRRLRAAGCPMPLNETTEPPCDLKVDAYKAESTIAYDRRAGTEYVFGARITNVSYRRLTLQGIRVRMPWVARLNWLGDPAIYSREPMYRFDSGRKFSRNEVINHSVWGGAELGPGESVEGLLLAYTMFDRVPPQYIHGDTDIARIFVIDQFEQKHRSEIEISVDRTATMRRLVPNLKRRSLFEREVASAGIPPQRMAEPENTQPKLGMCSDLDAEARGMATSGD